MPKDHRTYITVAVDMPDHPKLAELTDAQKWVIVEALCYSRKYLTDGVFEPAQWRKLTSARNRAAILKTGMAVEFKDGRIIGAPDDFDADFEQISEKFRESARKNLPQSGVIFLDYLEHQQSKAEVEELLEKRRSAGRKGGQAKAAGRSNGVANAVASAKQVLQQMPSKSVPELELEKEKDTYYVGISPLASQRDGDAVADEDGYAYEATLVDLATDPEPLEATEIVEAPKPSKRKAAEPRPDVERLVEHLRAAILANGNRAPASPAKVPASWHTAARLLLDRDGATLEQAIAVIDWCQADSFWRTNILSMPTFRDKYARLEAKTREAWRAQATPATPAGSRQGQRDAVDNLAAQFEAMLGLEDPHASTYATQLDIRPLTAIGGLPA